MVNMRYITREAGKQMRYWMWVGGWWGKNCTTGKAGVS